MGRDYSESLTPIYRNKRRIIKPSKQSNYRAIPMKFGITYNSNKSIWETGANSCALHLYKVLKSLEQDVQLITLSDSVKDVLDSYKCKYINDISKKSDKVGTLIDIDGLVRPVVRKRIAEKSVVFVRGFVQFSELDKSVYPDSSFSRSFDGVSEVWVWDVLNSEESLDCLRDLFGCPIRRVPFVWNSCHHLLSDSINNTNDNTNDNTSKDSKKKTIRIMEKNTDNTSSAILLLSGIPELKKANEELGEEFEYVAHCSSEMWENKFMKENVLTNIQYEKIPVKREDRLSYNKVDKETDIVLTHIRFCGFRPGLLDLTWLGIPFVHNSPILANLCKEFRIGYYPNNSLIEMIQAFTRVNKLVNNKRWATVSDAMKEAIRANWGVFENLEKWREVLGVSLSPPSSSLSPPSTTLPQVASLSPPSSSLSQRQPLVPQVSPQDKKQIIIGFSDMWPGFNYTSNFLIDALQNETKETDYVVKGIDYWNNKNEKVDCIIFGPYTEKWRQIDVAIPKIFFSCENWGTKDDPDNTVKLSLVPYRNSDKPDTFYLPTWMTFLNWFTDSTKLPSGTECEDNPIRLPIHFATRVHPKKFGERKEFCGFVVSNPTCSMRNNTFKVVNDYKRVNSGGALYNNIGEQLHLKYAGGGCGDISKYHFLEQHKFQICFENSQANGYITEKLLHSKIAGCIPIYWGDPDAVIDFLGDGFLNVSDCQKPEQVLSRIQELEKDTRLCDKMSQIPLLDSMRVQKGYSLMSDMSKRILGVCGIQFESKQDKQVKQDKQDKQDNQEHQEIKFPGVDKIVLVNLERRKDRWDNWCKANPQLVNGVERINAVDGKMIKLDSDIYKIFKHNSYHWKRGMIGCTLSHMIIWQKLLEEQNDNARYLILEDDMRFISKDWLETWNKMNECIPKDADLLYIGGVLPTNKGVLSSVLDNVNDYWAKIRPNKLFTGGSVELPIFHFCTYSYILTKSGAKKLMEWLEFSREKCFTCVDHFLGDPRIDLKKYVSVPIIANCFQEEDEAYQKSDFNTVDRADTFDSDIWNSIDNFSQEELRVFKDVSDGPVDSMKDTLAMVVREFTTTNTINKDMQQMQQKQMQQKQTQQKQIIYYLKEYLAKESDTFDLYESKWLNEILGDYELKQFDNYDNFVTNSWLLVMRPHSDKISFISKQLDKKGIYFNILHLSDEFCTDVTDFYRLDSCKIVIRNYLRKDITCDLKKVITIPLGYHHSSQEDKHCIPFAKRNLTWSFCGTSWFNRGIILEKFRDITPHRLVLLDKWQGPGMIDEKEYLDILRNSKFCPILRGNNYETFRLYECLENGVIPLVIRDEKREDTLFWKWIQEKLCLVEINGVDKAVAVIEYFLKNPEIALKYMDGLMMKWAEWKDEIKKMIVDSSD